MQITPGTIGPHDLSPREALQRLREGNFRFLNNLNRNHDLLTMVHETKDGQWPFAAILGCMDSRTAVELIFDQSFGDVFSIRIAGNVIGTNILGSLEYATAFADSKLIVVLGHTSCGAVKGACDDIRSGHLTELLNKIRPAVDNVQDIAGERSSRNKNFVEAVAVENARMSAAEILRQSTTIRDLVTKGKAGIIPAIYDIATGKVNFLDQYATFQV